MELVLPLAGAIFVAGIIFAAGKLTSRVERLEEWRGEMKKEFDEMFRSLRRIERRLGVDTEE